MKKIFLTVMTVAFALYGFGVRAENVKTDVNENDEEYPEITFVETSHNFGIFDREHGDQMCWFVFTLFWNGRAGRATLRCWISAAGNIPASFPIRSGSGSRRPRTGLSKVLMSLRRNRSIPTCPGGVFRKRSAPRRKTKFSAERTNRRSYRFVPMRSCAISPFRNAAASPGRPATARANPPPLSPQCPISTPDIIRIFP